MVTNPRAKMMLSEMNLRIHTNTYSQKKSTAPTRMDRGASWATNPPTYHSLMADLDGLSDPEDCSLVEGSKTLAASRRASLEALKLYSGCFDFCYTPMERFCAPSPSQLCGDVESLDASYVASEMRFITGTGCEEDGCPGSPIASSDTLSVSRYQTPTKERKLHVAGRSRSRRRLLKRRRNPAQSLKRMLGSG